MRRGNSPPIRLGLIGLIFAALAGAFVPQAYAETNWVGQPVTAVIESIRSDGHAVAYSTSVVTEDMVVLKQPGSSVPEEMIAELLQPYNLTVATVNGMIIVRAQEQGERQRSAPTARGSPKAMTTVSEIVVSASHYEFVRSAIDPNVFIDQRQMQKLPIMADDPIRAVQRIPGTASGGVSAQPHVRGGEPQDTGIVLNGNRLLEPFHVRNLQSLFSTIDARAIDGVEVFTGSFPVRYGHQMSGLVLIDTIEPGNELHSELGLSVFNTSFLNAGRLGDSDFGWLVSARRGNLDLILDEEFGEPSYNDLFAQMQWQPTNSTAISINTLIANNDVHVVTEPNPEEPEHSNSNSRSAQFWLNWTQDWSDSLTSTTTASVNTITDGRMETVDDPEEIVAQIDDNKRIDVARLEQHWEWQLNDSHLLRFGAEAEFLNSAYDYNVTADYFGTFLFFENQANSVERDIQIEKGGNALSAYVSDRWTLYESLTAEFGMRWDHQGYTGVGDSGQLSPRLGIAYSISPATEIRASLGRYYQAQQIHELQVEDGISTFFPAQRTDSGIVGLKHRFGDSGLSLRAEAYLRRSDQIRPRYENALNRMTVLAELKPDRLQIAPSKMTARGLELSIEQRGSDELTWWASYVLSDVQDRIGEQDVPRSWDQRHALQVGTVWSPGSWAFSAVGIIHSGWPKNRLMLEQRDNGDPVLRIVTNSGDRYRPFATLDLRVRYQRTVKVGELSFFFEVSNATNRNNICCTDFDVDTDSPGQPRLALENKHWLPWIPALGVLWEF